MGGRDHSIDCEVCGDEYSGFNGPDECPHIDLPARVMKAREFIAQRLAVYDPDLHDGPVVKASVAGVRRNLEAVQRILDGETYTEE